MFRQGGTVPLLCAATKLDQKDAKKKAIAVLSKTKYDSPSEFPDSQRSLRYSKPLGQPYMDAPTLQRNLVTVQTA